jgi:hypothetical protein
MWVTALRGRSSASSVSGCVGKRADAGLHRARRQTWLIVTTRRFIPEHDTIVSGDLLGTPHAVCVVAPCNIACGAQLAIGLARGEVKLRPPALRFLL